MPPRRTRKPRKPEAPISNPSLKLASTPTERTKEQEISTLWYNNLMSYPTRTMFDDIPLDYRINAFIHGTLTHLTPDWTVDILPHLRCISSRLTPDGAIATLTFDVKASHCNRLGDMHGGCAATLFDLATTLPLALVGRPGAWQQLGVSRTLNVTYLRPVPIDETVYLECEVIHAAQRLALCKGTMRLGREDGPIACTAEHGKFNIDSPVRVESKI